MTRRYLPLLFIMLASGFAFFTSCSTSQMVATQFIKNTQENGPAVWFIGASHLFTNCDKPNDTTGNPCPLTGSVDDSTFLEDYNRNFALQLADYGYRIFTYDEAEEFLAEKGMRLIINIAQLELEEVTDYFTDSEVFDTLEYFESFPITVLKLNSWIEVSLVDTTRDKQEVFFATDSVSDLIEGYFTQNQFRGDVSYTWKKYDMKPPIIGKFVGSSARDHARRLFDVWMNRFVRNYFDNTAGVNYSREEYFHYNPDKKRVEVKNRSEALRKL